MNIVFDFGAVLFTWQPALLMQQTFPQHASTFEAARHLAHQVFAHPDWHAFDQGLLHMEAVIAQTAERLDLPVDATRTLVQGLGQRLMPITETVAILQTLRTRREAGDGVTALYYLSNMPEPYARLLEQRFEFLQWFDGGVFSGDVKHIKPDPAIYQLLQSRYALTPARTVFIDDLKGNVAAARALDWQAIHFESAQQLEAELAALGL
jgi:putative hydrolase of the HAD superfamily